MEKAEKRHLTTFFFLAAAIQRAPPQTDADEPYKFEMLLVVARESVCILWV